ncbi:MAG: hypothetical protein DME65_12725 [Verrucomicrobia bacterium]|nr:MAG: hypothetical protein DME65_12725 [Verrucomicrobiota bacterium]
MFASRHLAIRMEVSVTREIAAPNREFFTLADCQTATPKENARKGDGERKSTAARATLRAVVVDLIFSGALGAKELGDHYANDNCCSRNQNSQTSSCPGSGRRFFAAPWD